MSRGQIASLIVSVALAVGLLVATLVADNRPVLGLDLQGGVAVVLQPTEPVDDERLDQAIEIIRNRVDAIGVAEPDITRQGGTIVVQMPGVRDTDRAIELIGQTAELRFREAQFVVNLDGPQSEVDDGLRLIDQVRQFDPVTGLPPTTTTTTTTPTSTTGTPATIEPPITTTPLPTVPEPTTTTTTEPLPPPDPDDLQTPPEEDEPEATVVLPGFFDNTLYVLGPTELTGEIVSSAAAVFQGLQWQVNLEFTGDGGRLWDEMATRMFGRPLGIVLDGLVYSAPRINSTEFRGRAVISGSFTESEAKNLALILRFGSLPVELETQAVQTVSATLGADALDAGLAAGIVGLILVAVFLIAYYRLLGLVAVLSLGVSGALLWSVISYLGSSRGLALTLAGTTGIIVSIGVAVDSNVVYYERIKEEVRRGRSIRSAADGSFRGAFSTIVKADIASLIGAGLLYYLTVGPVRGFALFLGLATTLDIIVSYLFMRPLVVLLARTKRTGQNRILGLPSPDPEPV